jgi:hypothetical protein
VVSVEFLEYWASRPEGQVPKQWRMRESTLVVTWLVKIMSDDLRTAERVDLDYNAVIDLYLALQRWTITKNALWMEKLLASRVARNPIECLSRAWMAPRVDSELAATIIRLLPSYDMIYFETEDDIRNVDLQITQLRLKLLPNQINFVSPRGELAIDFAPLLALTLSVQYCRLEDPELDEMASHGDKEALTELLEDISHRFRRTWGRMKLLAGSAPWMFQYRRSQH